MEIVWTVDTNIALGYHLSTDHLNKVARCIDDSKEIILFPSVGAEIKSKLDNNIAKIMASALSGKTSQYAKNSLLQKIYEETKRLKKYYPEVKDNAIMEFREIVSRFVSMKIVYRSKRHFYYERERDMKKLSPYMEPNKGKVDVIVTAYKKYKNEIFSDIINKINQVFSEKKRSKDREILMDLISFSYQYPETAVCFLTNDKDFYKRWKRVWNSGEYKRFLDKNNIKYGIIFHYIPDLVNESVDNYDLYPKLKFEEEINLYQILANCG